MKKHPVTVGEWRKQGEIDAENRLKRSQLPPRPPAIYLSAYQPEKFFFSNWDSIRRALIQWVSGCSDDSELEWPSSIVIVTPITFLRSALFLLTRRREKLCRQAVIAQEAWFTDFDMPPGFYAVRFRQGGRGAL